METTASQFVRNFSQFQDQAIKEPVIVKSHNRIVGVFISADDYERMHRAARQAYRAGELPADAREALDAAAYPTEAELKALGL